MPARSRARGRCACEDNRGIKAPQLHAHTEKGLKQATEQTDARTSPPCLGRSSRIAVCVHLPLLLLLQSHGRSRRAGRRLVLPPRDTNEPRSSLLLPVVRIHRNQTCMFCSRKLHVHDHALRKETGADRRQREMGRNVQEAQRCSAGMIRTAASGTGVQSTSTTTAGRARAMARSSRAIGAAGGGPAAAGGGTRSTDMRGGEAVSRPDGRAPAPVEPRAGTLADATARASCCSCCCCSSIRRRSRSSSTCISGYSAPTQGACE